MAHPQEAPSNRTNTSLLIRGAIWIAIGALIAAALVCVVWVLIGDQDGLIGRAFLTIFLLAAFAGIAILEAGLAPRRPEWLSLTSMVTWIIALLVGAVKIWLPEEPGEYFGGAERFFQLLLVVGILQLALLHVRLFSKAADRYVTVFTRVIYYLTLVFLVVLAGLLIFFLTFPETFEYRDLYWRIVVALAILTAVGTTLIPLLNVLFAPKRPRALSTSAAAVPGAPAAWPTYADGRTPLPMLLDGSPDWNAYYTGHPTPQHPSSTSAQPPAIAAPSQMSDPAQAPAAPPAPAGPPAYGAPHDAPPAPESPAAPPTAPPAAPPIPPAPPVPPQ